MKKEGMGKKGQGMSITTIMLILLGIVVVVLLIIGVTTGFDFISDLFERAPSFEVIVQSCGKFGENKLVGDYCKAFKEAKLPSGQKSFLNCQFDDIEALNAETKLSDSVCGKEGDNAKKFCEDKRAEVTRQGRTFDASNFRVNGRFCDEWGVVNLKSCVDSGGEFIETQGGKSCSTHPPTSGNENEGFKTEILPKGEYSDSKEGSVCCVYQSCSQLGGTLKPVSPGCSSGTEVAKKSRENPTMGSSPDIYQVCCVLKPAK